MSQDHHFIYQPPQDPLDIIYQDNDLIIINKPAGLLSVMGRLPEHFDSAYLRILQIYPQAKITHRLDMATSGLLMFAKHRDAEVAMSKLFQKRQIEKNYVALVQGQLADNGCVDVPLITDWEQRPRQKVDFEIGKPAKTLYEMMQYDVEQDITRVLLTPITGRSHQLRVHMAYISHPIIGDKLYHPEPSHGLFNRMTLHASYLSFQHPFLQKKLEIVSKAPF